MSKIFNIKLIKENSVLIPAYSPMSSFHNSGRTLINSSIN